MKNPGLDKKALWKDIRKGERKAAREKMRTLKDAKRSARDARILAMREAKAGCREAREAAKARATSTCAGGRDRYVEARARFQAARAALLAERQHRREMRAIEASAKGRTAEKRARLAKASERRQESDDEVRTNIPAELHPLFEKVKRGVKGSERRSRTEAFLEYVEAHPAEVWAEEDPYEAAAQRMQERAAHANPKRRGRKGWSAKHAIGRYKRDHWGQKGKARVRASSAPAIAHAPRRAPEGFRVVRVPDPRAGTLVELGKLIAVEYKDARTRVLMRLSFAQTGAVLAYNRTGLVVDGGRYALSGKKPEKWLVPIGELASITYRTRKGRDAPQGADYVHRFESPRPTLARGPGGIVLAGGGYRVTIRGIVG